MGALPDGWLTDEEADELRWLASARVVLELGAWKGRSTVALADTAHYVISVDRHQGIDGHGESLDEYLANVRDLPNVAIAIGRFEQVVPHLHQIEMVYIDGDHDANSVERDTRLACYLRPFVIAYHDWDFHEVREGAGRVRSVFSRPPHSLVGSVASFLL